MDRRQDYGHAVVVRWRHYGPETVVRWRYYGLAAGLEDLILASETEDLALHLVDHGTEAEDSSAQVPLEQGPDLCPEAWGPVVAGQVEHFEGYLEPDESVLLSVASYGVAERVTE